MDTDLLYYALGIFCMVLLSALFSASETGLTGVSRARIYHLHNEGHKRGSLVYRLREKKEALISSILIGNNVINIFASALATSLAIKVWGEHGIYYVTAIMSVVIIIFAEILPKTIALQHAERTSLLVAPIMAVAVKLCAPLNWVLHRFIRVVLKILRLPDSPEMNYVSALDSLRGSIALHHDQGQMVKDDKDMLSSILDLDDILLEDIMTHRKQVDMIDINLPPEQIVDYVINTNHTRMPLWEGDPNNIIGVLHIKTLVRALKAQDFQATREALLALASAPWFIPATTSLKEQLLAFRQRRQHLAFVVDEYGAWLGIVTLEDILEEIVGEIDDEHDQVASKDVVKIAPDAWMVRGDVTIRELNRELDLELEDEDASTVAGLVINLARKIPHKGEVFTSGHLEWTVLERSNNQITRLKLRESEPESED